VSSPRIPSRVSLRLSSAIALSFAADLAGDPLARSVSLARIFARDHVGVVGRFANGVVDASISKARFAALSGAC